MSKAQFLLENQRDGEVYAGLILVKEHWELDYHLFLLAAKPETDLNWKDALEWAISVGGQLPNLEEQSLLITNQKEQFGKTWHWSSKHHANNSDYAWMQNFYDGNQYTNPKSSEYRARAVRRVYLKDES